MPQYLDHHPTIPDMPPEIVAFITQRLESDQPDESGEVIPWLATEWTSSKLAAARGRGRSSATSRSSPSVS